MSPRVLVPSLAAAALLPACIAYNEPCTAFVDDPDAIVGYLGDAVTLREDEIRLDDSAMGQLVAESYLGAFAGADLPRADLAIENAGAIREEGLCEPRPELPAGPVRRKVLREVLAFDDTVELIELTEQGLKDVLEHSYAGLGTLDLPGGFLQLAGAEVAVDCSRPAEVLGEDRRETPGQRVVAIVLRPRAPVACASDADCVDAAYPRCVEQLVSLSSPGAGERRCGRPIDVEAPSTTAKVRLVANSFIAEGNDNYFDFADPAAATSLARSDSFNFQIVASYFQATYPEAAPFPGSPEDRIVQLNCR